MAQPILTLQVPKGGRGIPVATTANQAVLRHFRSVVLDEWANKVDCAEDEIEALLARLELERVTKAFTVLIPEESPDADEP